MSNRSVLQSLAILLLTTDFSWAQSPEVPAELLPPEPVVTPALASPFLNCDCDAECRQPNRFWARADYLLWWTKGRPLPASTVINPKGFTVTDLTTGAIFNKPSLIGDELGGSARSGDDSAPAIGWIETKLSGSREVTSSLGTRPGPKTPRLRPARRSAAL